MLHSSHFRISFCTCEHFWDIWIIKNSGFREVKWDKHLYNGNISHTVSVAHLRHMLHRLHACIRCNVSMPIGVHSHTSSRRTSWTSLYRNPEVLIRKTHNTTIVLNFVLFCFRMTKQILLGFGRVSDINGKLCGKLLLVKLVLLTTETLKIKVVNVVSVEQSYRRCIVNAKPIILKNFNPLSDIIIAIMIIFCFMEDESTALKV